jgi:hypothetical protein
VENTMVDPRILEKGLQMKLRKQLIILFLCVLNFKLISKFLQRRGWERRGVPTPDYVRSFLLMKK